MTPSRRAAIAHELGHLALALEQAGAYIDKQRLSFAEYLRAGRRSGPAVLGWHDPRLMQYPASVAVTWETTFAQLGSPERRLLDVLAWLAPEPIPIALFDAAPLAEAISDPREALAGLAGYSLARFDASGDAVLVHRLVQEITRGRIPAADRGDSLQIALEAVNDVAPVRGRRCPHLGCLDAPGGACGGGQPVRRRRRDRRADGPADGSTRHVLAGAWPVLRRRAALSAAPWRSTSGATAPTTPSSPHASTTWRMLLQATDRLAEAEPLMRRALAIDERSYGPDHPDVASDLNNLAKLLQGHRPTGRGRAAHAPRPGDRRAELRPRPPRRRRDLNNLAHVAARHRPTGRGRAALRAAPWRSTSGATAPTTPTSPETSTTWRSC